MTKVFSVSIYSSLESVLNGHKTACSLQMQHFVHLLFLSPWNPHLINEHFLQNPFLYHLQVSFFLFLFQGALFLYILSCQDPNLLIIEHPLRCFFLDHLQPSFRNHFCLSPWDPDLLMIENPLLCFFLDHLQPF